MKRYVVPPKATVEQLTVFVPGSLVRMTDGRNNPRNTHRGLSSKELSGELPWGVYSAEPSRARTTDAGAFVPVLANRAFDRFEPLPAQWRISGIVIQNPVLGT